jgi:hypothetical protein
MEGISRKCNPMMDLSKFASNKKILIGVTLLKVTPRFSQQILEGSGVS